MAIIQASTVLSLAEKVIMIHNMMKTSLNSLFCADSCFALCCPLVDSTDRGDGGSAAPEDDGP